MHVQRSVEVPSRNNYCRRKNSNYCILWEYVFVAFGNQREMHKRHIFICD
jgi:hypothetical protein